MHTESSCWQMGIFLRLLQCEIQKKQQETVQSWKPTQVHCNYNRTWPSCGLHSHNYSITASTNRPSAHSSHKAIARGQSRAILAIAADNAQSCCHGNLWDLVTRYRKPKTGYFESERIHPALDVKKKHDDNLCTHGIRLSLPSVLTPSLFWT